MASTTIEDMISSSVCFGYAYDGSVKECKMCDVRSRCKAKCEQGATGDDDLPVKPESDGLASKEEITFDEDKQAKAAAKKAEKPVKKPSAKASKAKKEVKYADDMPDFKAMEQDDLFSLAEERGINLADFDKYANDNIKRMRVTMALKATYAVG